MFLASLAGSPTVTWASIIDHLAAGREVGELVIADKAHSVQVGPVAGPASGRRQAGDGKPPAARGHVPRGRDTWRCAILAPHRDCSGAPHGSPARATCRLGDTVRQVSYFTTACA